MPKNYKNKDIFNEIINENNIYESYKKALKGKNKYSIEAMRFIPDEVYNLKQLIQSLMDGTYQFDGYIRFKVFEPKERVIDAPHFKDKIVQLAINNVLKEIYNPTFIFDSYACIDGKGTHKCADRISYFMRKAKWEYGEDTFIIKCDIKKFFYTIDRGILKKIIKKKIKCKRTLRLLFKIINSAEVIDELGLPLGNTLSQIFANIYLNELDQYCKRKLSLKYYVRYLDDIIIIVENKDKAKEILSILKDFIETNLNLKFNKNKTQIFPINQGVNAIGYKIYTTHRLLRDNSKKKIKRKIKAMPHLIIEDKLTPEKAEQMLNSWNGHAKHSCSYNFIKGLLIKHSFLYRRGKILKIDIRKIKIKRKIIEPQTINCGYCNKKILEGSPLYEISFIDEGHIYFCCEICAVEYVKRLFRCEDANFTDEEIRNNYVYTRSLLG